MTTSICIRIQNGECDQTRQTGGSTSKTEDRRLELGDWRRKLNGGSETGGENLRETGEEDRSLETGGEKIMKAATKSNARGKKCNLVVH